MAAFEEFEMTIQLAGINGGTVDLPSEALQVFKAAFKGQLLTPADAAYEETRQIWNAMIDRRPGLIARCSGTADVVQAVRFARCMDFSAPCAAAATTSPGLPSARAA